MHVFSYFFHDIIISVLWMLNRRHQIMSNPFNKVRGGGGLEKFVDFSDPPLPLYRSHCSLVGSASTATTNTFT